MSSANKSSAMVWIIIAYIACIAAGFVYLQFFSSDNLLLDSFIADLIATVVIFIFGRAFKNSSFYDAYWSVIPPLFLVFWYMHPQSQGIELRYILISIPLWFWAIRLTYNWAKHWDGMNHEDWRYVMLKEKFGKFEIIIDFFGIQFFPTVQVFAGMLPIYTAVHLSNNSVNWLDYVAFTVGISAAVLQLMSDRQLRQFLATAKKGDVINKGLWGWSRHPNYFAEISIWLSMGLFGVAAYPQGWWWQLIGFTLMALMFVFISIPMMEKRSLERRPEYQKTIDSVSMLIPLPPKKG